MIKRGKELGNVKCKCACDEVFNPSWLNNVGKNNPCIHGRSLFETFKLTRMDEIIGNHMELKMFSNHFLKDFSYYVKKNNREKRLGWVVRCLVRFGNNNCYWCLEMRWPVPQIYMGISNINEFTNALFDFDDCLDMTLC